MFAVNIESRCGNFAQVKVVRCTAADRLANDKQRHLAQANSIGTSLSSWDADWSKHFMNLVDSQYRSTSSSNMLINTCTTARIASTFLPSLYKQITTNSFIKDKLTGDREIQFTIKHIEVCNNSTDVALKVNDWDSKLVPHPFLTWHYIYCNTLVAHQKSVTWRGPLAISNFSSDYNFSKFHHSPVGSI